VIVALVLLFPTGGVTIGTRTLDARGTYSVWMRTAGIAGDVAVTPPLLPAADDGAAVALSEPALERSGPS
jgi:hypothetical protein